VLFRSLFIFLFLCFSWEALPWKASADEIHKNNSYLFQIISTSLLDA